MKRILFAILFAAYVILTFASCSRSVCPSQTQGRVPGKFKS
jgi:hypothetical protein